MKIMSDIPTNEQLVDWLEGEFMVIDNDRGPYTWAEIEKINTIYARMGFPLRRFNTSLWPDNYRKVE